VVYSERLNKIVQFIYAQVVCIRQCKDIVVTTVFHVLNLSYIHINLLELKA